MPALDDRSVATAGEPRLNEPAGILRRLLAEPIVTVAGRPWTGRDLVTAGAMSGRWPELERELALGLVSLREWTPPAADIRAGVRELRYARRLISADEFSAWMRRRELTQHDVIEVVRRRLAREHVRPQVSTERSLDHDAEVAALPAEAICTGALAACAEWAIDRSLCLEDRLAPVAEESKIIALLERESRLRAVEISAEDAEERRARAALVLSACAAYDRRVAEDCTPETIAAHVRQRALDWLQLELDCFPCPSVGAAAEVAALLGEGSPPERVSELSGLKPERLELRLEDAPEGIQGHLGGAHPGDVVGPLPDDELRRVWLVRSRRAARADDPEVNRRACAEIVDELMRGRRAGKVVWHDRS